MVVKIVNRLEHDSCFCNKQSLFEKEVLIILQDPNSSYSDLNFFLRHGYAPENLDPIKRRVLQLKATPYHLINGIMSRKNFDGVFFRCLEQAESEKVLVELHSVSSGEHFGGETIAHKVLKVGYYWPMLFKDSHAFARKCQVCQKFVGREKRVVFTLQVVMIENPFQQWGIDIVGHISPNYSMKTQIHHYYY